MVHIHTASPHNSRINSANAKIKVSICYILLVFIQLHKLNSIKWFRPCGNNGIWSKKKRHNTRYKNLFCHLPWWWWHCWLELSQWLNDKAYGGQKTRLRRKKWTFSAFTLHVLVHLLAWQPTSHTNISGLSHQGERFVVVTSALIILKCSAYSGPATLSADDDSPVFFTLYRCICLRSSNHPLLI